MEVKFTEEQQSVIDARKSNILVSAAAGSGKTAVLVRRIIGLIEEGCDVDHLLVVTFTKAAASQMKEKITEAIMKSLSEDPENLHMQRQETLIHNAQITTIDSFCQYVIRNNFNTIGLAPSFRVGDEGELKLLKEDVMKEMLEDEYEAADEGSDFLFCMDYFSTGPKDTKVEEYINQLFNFSESMPWPEDWIAERAEDYQVSGEDFDDLDFVKECMTYAKRSLSECVFMMESAARISAEADGPYMYLDLINSEKEAVMASLEYDTYNELFDGIRAVSSSFGRLSSKKDDSVNSDKREYVKDLRKKVKDRISVLESDYFAMTAETITEQMKLCDRAVRELCRLTLVFKKRFDEKKSQMHLIDFSDMEHFALRILFDHDTKSPTPVALEYREYFAEVLIDEYQDSNNVQEMILSAISGDNVQPCNRFMVGDVKQSIYKFRMARPEIFMDKLTRFRKDEKAPDRRIDLHKNFRSRSQVLDATNYIFEKIMGRDIGGVEYDEDARLITGASYDEPKMDVAAEVLIHDEAGTLPDDDKDAAFLREMTAREKEALMVAERIKKLRKKNSDLKYSDIVILLRSLSGWDDTFKRVLEREQIPAYVESKSGYFDAPEVAVLLNMLSVIDNPRQDIPLVSVMRSDLFGFTDEELAVMKAAVNDDEKASLTYSLYDSLLVYAGKEGELPGKVRAFSEMVESLRRKSTYTPVHELLLQIIDNARYDLMALAMPAGAQRSANIEMLLSRALDFERTGFKGLFRFVRYIEHMKIIKVDYGEAGIVDENADVVRIMSIHKSKGLEFPVVFVSGLSKEFNRMDTRGDLIADMDLGLGVRCIDTQLRVKYDTLKRRIIADKMKIDSLGEELRVLYVALTRAKEKLIMTASVKDLTKTLSLAVRDISGFAGSGKLLPYSVREGAGSFFDLVLPALIRHPQMGELLSFLGVSKGAYEEYADKKAPDIRFKAVSDEDLKAELISDSAVRLLSEEDLKNALITAVGGADERIIDRKMYDRLKEKFRAVYAHADLRGLFTKTTVSELKHAAMEEAGVEISSHPADFVTVAEADAKTIGTRPGFDNSGTDAESTGQADAVPLASSGEGKKRPLTGADRGTAYHRVMELLDDEILGDKELMKAALEGRDISKRLFAFGMKKAGEGYITKDQVKSVQMSDIALFLKSDLGQRMGEAHQRGELFREKPFMMGVSAKELKPSFPESETVLIQGIIDAWFIEDGEIVLLDYKTDRVKTEKELTDRYRVQLELYSRALTSYTEKKVKEVYIYSFTLGKVILL